MKELDYEYGGTHYLFRMPVQKEAQAVRCVIDAADPVHPDVHLRVEYPDGAVLQLRPYKMIEPRPYRPGLSARLKLRLRRWLFS